MPWLYLVLAAAALAVAFKTTSMLLMAICLVAALALAVAFMLGALARRVEERAGTPDLVLDPVELQRLREQAEARRAAGPPPPSDPA